MPRITRSTYLVVVCMGIAAALAIALLMFVKADSRDDLGIDPVSPATTDTRPESNVGFDLAVSTNSADRSPTAATEARFISIHVVDEASASIPGAAIGLLEGSRQLYHGETDSSGMATFRIDRAHSGLLAHVQAAGFLEAYCAAWPSGDAKTTVTVALTRPELAIVRGTVRTFAGQPVPKCDVRLKPIALTFNETMAAKRNVGELHAVTDASGSFEIKNAPARQPLWAIAGESGESKLTAIASLEPGETRDVLLHLFDVQSLSICVRDATNQVPVISAAFQASERLGYAFTWATPMEVDRSEEQIGMPTELFQTADHEGVISLAIRKGRRLEGTVRAPGFVPQSINLALDSTRIEVLLQRSVATIVYLRDEFGNELCAPKRSYTLRPGCFPSFGPFVDNPTSLLRFAQGSPGSGWLPVRFEDTGQYLTIDLPENADNLDLAAYCETKLVAKTRLRMHEESVLEIPRAIACPTFGALKLRLVGDRDGPPPGVLDLRVLGRVDGPIVMPALDVSYGVLADANGELFTDHCLPGIYTLRLLDKLTGASAVADGVRIESNVLTEVGPLAMKAAGEILINTACAGVATSRFRSRLWSYQLGAYLDAPSSLPVKFDLLGGIGTPQSWRRVPAGVYRVEVRAPGAAPQCADVEIASGEHVETSFLFVSAPRCTVMLPVNGIDESLTAMELIDRDGRFVERVLPARHDDTAQFRFVFFVEPGEYTLRLLVDGAETQTKRIETPAHDSTIVFA